MEEGGDVLTLGVQELVNLVVYAFLMEGERDAFSKIAPRRLNLEECVKDMGVVCAVKLLDAANLLKEMDFVVLTGVESDAHTKTAQNGLNEMECVWHIRAASTVILIEVECSSVSRLKNRRPNLVLLRPLIFN